MHYYCRKKHKNIKNSQIIEKNIVFSLCPSLWLLQLARPSLSSTPEFFQFIDTVLCQVTENFKRQKGSVVPYIVFWFENGFLQVKPTVYILRLLIFYQIFLPPYVKRSAIITCKHHIYEKPHELPNGLRFYEIRKYQKSV